METQGKKKFSVRARLHSANPALRGIGLFFTSTHNAQAYIVFVAIVAYLGYALRISHIEWIVLVTVIALVFVTEALNTAIEIHMDLTSPEQHPAARNTKDVAAGAVLLAVIFASAVGMLIFVPKLIPFLQS